MGKSEKAMSTDNPTETARPSQCIHAKLQLQLVVPEACLVRGDIGAWYTCLQCGSNFRSDIRPYQLKVSYGTAGSNAGEPQKREKPPVTAQELREHAEWYSATFPASRITKTSIYWKLRNLAAWIERNEHAK